MNDSLLLYQLPDARPKRLSLPDIPEEKWCDFRREYESGMTLKAIAEKHVCDPRTVRVFLSLNKSSQEIGRQRAPTILSPWLSQVEQLYQEYSRDGEGICQISRKITLALKQCGYTGTERTIRNHLRSKYHVTRHP